MLSLDKPRNNRIPSTSVYICVLLVLFTLSGEDFWGDLLADLFPPQFGVLNMAWYSHDPLSDASDDDVLVLSLL